MIQCTTSKFLQEMLWVTVRILLLLQLELLMNLVNLLLQLQ